MLLYWLLNRHLCKTGWKFVGLPPNLLEAHQWCYVHERREHIKQFTHSLKGTKDYTTQYINNQRKYSLLCMRFTWIAHHCGNQSPWIQVAGSHPWLNRLVCIKHYKIWGKFVLHRNKRLPFILQVHAARINDQQWQQFMLKELKNFRRKKGQNEEHQ